MGDDICWDGYYQLLNELRVCADKLRPWYDIDKVKPWSVYVWTKGEDGQNVFDIEADRIVSYVDGHKIPGDAISVIEEIMKKLKEIERWGR